MSSFLLRTPARSLTLNEVARLLGLSELGGAAGQVRVDRIVPLDAPAPGGLGLVADARYLDRLVSSRAAAFLVGHHLAAAVAEAEGKGTPPPRPLVVVKDPHQAMRQILEALHPEAEPEGAEVHPTAVVDSSVILGDGVRVGPYAVIEAGVEVGTGSRIGAHVTVGARARIGEGCRLLPQCVVYPDAILGDRVVLHAGARVGVDGFGYVFEEGSHRRLPHVGGCILEDEVEIGANSCVDRGSIADTRIGAGTKVDNLVHVGHNTRVGQRGLLVAQVGISGSCTLGDGVIVGGQVGIAGHLSIGDGARLAAQAGIIGDVAPGETVMGFPARPQREFLKATASLYRLPDLVRRVRTLEAGRQNESS